MLIKMGNTAVSEIIGAFLLLAIAISIFSVVYMNVLSDEGPEPTAYVTIVGKLENDDIIFEHRRGESLGLETELLLSIGGKQYNFKVGDGTLLNPEDETDGVWNIGERLIYSGFNFAGLEVKSTIVDEESKDIVLWGNLQDGIIISSFGGIWHFDENQGNIAHDSLGVDDFGRLMPDILLGPRWTNEDQKSGASALRFDGINDFVSIDGRFVSLDITDQLSIEAWMQIPESMILDDYTFAPDFGYNPKILQISDDTYAVVYRGQEEPTDPEKKWGVVKTVKIYEDGSTSFDIYNNSLVFWDANNVAISWPEIIHVKDDLYLISYYTNPQGDGYFNTVEIAENGTITKPALDFSQFGDDVFEPDIIHINDTICAVIYRDSSNPENGIIKTIEIADNGQTIDFVNIANNSFEFDEGSACFEPDIINVAGNTYTITYRGDNDLGVIATIEISDDGSITQQINDSFVFDSINKSYNPQLFRIADNIFGITYYDNDPAGDGFITTVEISDDGIITNPVIDSSKFEDDYCVAPYITYLHDDYYSIAYRTSSNNDGALATIEIDINGTISKNAPKKLIFTDDKKNYFAQECHLTHVAGDVVAIVFSSGSQSGQPHQGHMITFNSLADLPENPPPGSNVPYTSGIYKDNAYGVFLNRKYIGASIGNDFFLKQVNVSSDWNHVVLTYDGSNVNVYLNGSLEISEATDEAIPSNTNDIFIGENFFGYIDEAAILPWVLTPAEIQVRYSP